MPRSRDDDFDDDDYFPREQRREGARGFSFVLVGGIVLGVVVLAGLALFMARSSRQAAERNVVEAVRAERAIVEQPTPPKERESNWKRAIGSWLREPMGKSDREHPFRFDFRPDFTASFTNVNVDGIEEAHECTVKVFTDNRDELSLQLLVPNGFYTFHFLFQADGTLVLKDGGAGLVFTRAK